VGNLHSARPHRGLDYQQYTHTLTTVRPPRHGPRRAPSFNGSSMFALFNLSPIEMLVMVFFLGLAALIGWIVFGRIARK